jgi:NhaA family Na+:H+ antiporter
MALRPATVRNSTAGDTMDATRNARDSSTNAIREFLRLESAGGIVLIIATVLAMIAANTPLSQWYQQFLDLPVTVKIGEFAIDKPLLLWINDGLMAVFFFLVGLELKREFIEGELSKPSQVLLPLIGAVGGMAVPAALYAAFNHDNALHLSGWAIPTATDIAFALGVLSLFGSRVPPALKLFLLALAIFDDMGAIVIIAIFYSHDLSLLSLGIAAVVLALLWIINQRGTLRISAYLLLGLIMWVAVLKSGVHATLAGVAIALFIPLRVPAGVEAPLRRLEHDLHPSVAFGILPLFAFANTGVSVAGFGLDTVLASVPLGITVGLFVGKQVGVFLLSWLAIRLRIAELPRDVSWLQMYGVSILCGIGFTMSLFISSLAFHQKGTELAVDERTGILLGSALSTIFGYIILGRALPKSAIPKRPD